MSTEWYYAAGGKENGPITLEQLRQLSVSGALHPHDLVWNASMNNWAAAKHVPELSTVATHPPVAEAIAAPQPAAAPLAQELGYELQGMQTTEVSLGTVEMLRQTRPWVLTMAIFMFISAAGCGIVAIVFLVMAGFARSGNDMPATVAAAVGVGYLLLSAFMLVGGLYLTKYSTRIVQLTRRRRTVDLESALEAQKSYWKLLVLFTLGMIGLYFITIVVVIAVKH